MKRILIVTLLLITPFIYGQNIEPYKPLIDESLQYLRDNINRFTYYEIRDNLLITESGQIYENPHIGIFIYEKIHNLLPLSGENGIFEKQYRELIFKRLKLNKDYEFLHWKIIVLDIKDNYIGIVFKRGFTREDKKGIIRCIDSSTVALFLYEYNEEQKKHLLKDVLLNYHLSSR